MPDIQPPADHKPARRRCYHRHYYSLQYPANLLIQLMNTAVALGKFPEQVVGAALRHFLGFSAEEQRVVLAAFEAYAPFGKDTPGRDGTNDQVADSIPSARFPKDRWEHHWDVRLLAEQAEQKPAQPGGGDATRPPMAI